MKRLGMYSGRIYEENEVENMKECGVMLSDEQIDDEDHLEFMRRDYRAGCLICRGCPESQKEV